MREKALEWWRDLSLNIQFSIMIVSKDMLLNDVSRKVSTLTGREIEILYKEFNQPVEV